MATIENPIRVLSIDGGGMRGIIPAIIIHRLDELISRLIEAQKLSQRPIGSFFDIIAGTSTGAIIAVGLAGRNREGRPLATPGELIQFYQKDAAQVFRGGRWGYYLDLVWSILRPKFNPAVLERSFARICHDVRLSDVATNLIVPAFEGEGAFLFRGGPNWPLGSQPDYYLRDVLRASTAAPYVFPPARFAAIGQQEPRAFIDGGMVANNPSMHAYLDALKLFGDRRRIFLISLGTGNDFRPIDYHTHRSWGGYKWINPLRGVPLVQILMQGQSHDTHRNLQRFIPDQRWYIRLDTHSDHEMPAFDDASPAAVRFFSKLADEYIASNGKLLEELAGRLVAMGPTKCRE